MLRFLFSVFHLCSTFTQAETRGCERGVLPSKETLQCEVTKGTDIRYLVLRPSPEAEARAHAGTHTHERGRCMGEGEGVPEGRVLSQSDRRG